MAKVKLGNVKGPQGEQGVRGSEWRVSDKMTGQSTSGTAFPGTGFGDSIVNDVCLNPVTFDLYRCQVAGDADTAEWVWECNIKGPQGDKGDKGDPTTVDAALSATSTNPVQNKVVNQKFADVQDSLDSITGSMNIMAFNKNNRIGFQLTSKNSWQSCIIGVTYDNRLYIDSADEDGKWSGPRWLQLSLSRLSTSTPRRLNVEVNPGGSYTVPSDGVYVLTALSKSTANANAWWLKDGVEFFGVNKGEACIPLWLKKGAKLTTRSGEDFSYAVRSVFQPSLGNIKLGFICQIDHSVVPLSTLSSAMCLLDPPLNTYRAMLSPTSFLQFTESEELSLLDLKKRMVTYDVSYVTVWAKES